MSSDEKFFMNAKSKKWTIEEDRLKYSKRTGIWELEIDYYYSDFSRYFEVMASFSKIVL